MSGVDCLCKETRNGRHTIKQLALGTQSITLGDKIVKLLSTLQHALDGLVNDNLRLVQLLLDLENAVSLMRILIFGEVLLQFWEGQSWLAISPGRSGVLGEEFIDPGSHRQFTCRVWCKMVGKHEDKHTLETAAGELLSLDTVDRKLCFVIRFHHQHGASRDPPRGVI